MMQLHNNKRIAYISLLVALSLIFSYVESLIPVNFGIPGVKLGLANIVSVIAVYLFGPLTAVLIVILRVCLAGFLFGNVFSIIYSVSGGLASIAVMSILKKTDKFSMTGISIGGGVFHNMGQLLVACVVIDQLKLSYYGPILIIAGIITGFLVGIICSSVYKRLLHFDINHHY